MLTPALFTRGAALELLGFKPADALHVAAAEETGADVLLSCDDRFCRAAQRHAKRLRVAVRNPLPWLNEVEHGPDPG
jgi:predicted nucleic acid-binding protein